MDGRGAGPAVVLTAVSKSFGNRLAVDRVSFAVPAGTCFGLLGPNGAGKSTTLKLIYGFLRPASGSIRVAGIDAVAQPRAARQRLGVAPQDDVLDPDLSAAQNLLFHAHYCGIPGARARVPGWLETVGLDGRGDAAVHTLSSGLRRRLVLARALVNEPEIVVLDEPTRGLDRESREEYLASLLELKGRGVTLLLATHELAEAEALCEQAAFMEAGRIREIGPAAGVLHAATGVRRLSACGSAGAC